MHSTVRRVLLAVTVAAALVPVGLAQTGMDQVEALRSALAHQQYGAAVMLAREQTTTHPEDARGWVLQALALSGDKQPKEALASIHHALELRPDYLPAMEAGAQIAYQAKDASASEMLQHVLTLEPKNPTAHAMASVLALEKHACGEALDHFEKAGSLPEMDRNTRIRLSICFSESGNLAAAAKLLQQVHTDFPDDAIVTADLASLYIDSKRCSDAVALLQGEKAAGRALDADLMNLLSAAYAGNEQVTEAIESYRSAIEEHPHDDRNYIDLALVSMDHQSPAVAIGVLDSGIRNNPKSAALYTMRGSVNAQIAKNDAAQSDFEAAERLSPSQTFGTIGLGVLLRDQSNLEDAQHVLQEKLKQKPDDAVLNYMLSDVLIRKGANPGDPGFAEAKRLLETSLKLQPDLAQAHAALGKLDLKAGNVSEAIAQLETAVKLVPNDRTALNQLVAAYRRTDRSADANRVAAQLASAVAEERAEETQKNRVHLMIDAPLAAKSASGAGSPK